ncbi:MAG: hypothetical protein K0S48_13 [Ramlibacter sp.]|jgi:hypothetical protein|nr:hypothetical protein [Ramlibacter sp.]
MITDRPLRPGAYRYWPLAILPEPDAAVIVGVRMDSLGEKHVIWPDGRTVPAAEVKGQWELMPEPPEERKVFRRRG